MRHSCSSSVSGLVITNISLLSTSCFTSSRPPCAFTTTVSQVSLNFFRSCARPWACTRILWNTRPLRRGVAEVTSVIRPSSTARPLPSIAHPSGCSPTATWPKAANECLRHGWHRGWSDPQQVPPKKDPTHQVGPKNAPFRRRIWKNTLESLVSVVAAALVGLGLDVLFGKLDEPAAQLANLAGTAARETLGLQFGPGGLAGFRSLRFRSSADLSVPSRALGIMLAARAGSWPGWGCLHG